MKVRCESLHLTEEQRMKLGVSIPLVDYAYALTVGQEYLVLGLSFQADPKHVETGAYVYVPLGDKGVGTCALGLFAITDPRVSRYWQIRTSRFDQMTIVDLLPPPLFAMLNIADDETRTSEQIDAAYAAALVSSEYKHIYQLLKNEFESASSFEDV